MNETYSKEQLRIFESEIEEYNLDTSKFTGNKYFGVLGRMKWFIDKGGLSPRSTEKELFVSDIQKFKELQNKLEQTMKYIGKKEYAKRMEAKRATTTEKKTIVDSFMSIAKQTPDIYDIPQEMLEFHGLDKPDENEF